MEEVILKRRKFFMSMEDQTMKNYFNLRHNFTWMDSSGKVHDVAGMDSNYIRNCINKIKRDEFDEDRVAKLPALENELIYRQILANDTR